MELNFSIMTCGGTMELILACVAYIEMKIGK